MREVIYYDSPIVKLKIVEVDGWIEEVSFADGEDETAVKQPSDNLKNARKQLKEYFDGKRTAFDLKMKLHGTEFQKKVWTYLSEIPYGETRTYKDVAEAIGSPKGFRAVGMANNKNPIAIIYPCHRVIGASGMLVGYGGGLDIKEQLLRLEGVL
ncbi:methylated-DNA--[protein]-cysteine S-methyltransferase [Breznakia pachnodae]|uniref:Methylated-DNA--protein-cysteine methyltransferase n=1 Tax=Breznakia pachnodae TaxID=265178 RepID=A0ABU0DXW8_9FIRM|nr:methylated-DNA--[protein]-cysteine S-methyltransferase [Breznakia pachnodae]MDQ0359400.1 methylated-DNA-[protein]-cysteine S-methyltransferase [Breznakia pachnodae]